jgi:hypothetical protein
LVKDPLFPTRKTPWHKNNDGYSRAIHQRTPVT